MDCPGGEWRGSPEGVMECPGGAALCGRGSLAGRGARGAGFPQQVSPAAPAVKASERCSGEAVGAQPRDANGRRGQQAQCSPRIPLCPFWPAGRFRAAVD